MTGMDIRDVAKLAFNATKKVTDDLQKNRVVQRGLDGKNLDQKDKDLQTANTDATNKAQKLLAFTQNNKGTSILSTPEQDKLARMALIYKDISKPS
jgi:hypothetical protein